jgi:hypothetical protein
MQYIIIDFSTSATSYYDIIDDYLSKQAAANDTSLSSSELETAKSEYSVVENEYLDINNKAHDKLVNIYYYWIVLLAYWFRNVCQIIYAKLRKKSFDVIIGEFILS